MTWRIDLATVQRVYQKSGAGTWDLPLQAFGAALESSVQRAFSGSSPDPADLERYLTSLHLEDLALACACANGSEVAWEHFIREHRPGLYRAANAIDASGGARDLADSLYGELFGLQERDGERRSHFTYFHGRSSLATWLRAVLSQRHVDRLRSVRRLEPLPADEATAAIPSPANDVDPAWAGYLNLMRVTVAAAVAALNPRHRLRLRCYYAQDLTLAQIGKMLGESEATSSRHLARARREVRAFVERELRDRHHMVDAQISECFSSVLANSGSLDMADLLGSGPGPGPGSGPGPGPGPGPMSDPRKEIGQDRSTGKETSRAGRR